MISVLEIERKGRNNNVKEDWNNNICLQILFLANTLLNSEPYTI